MIKMHVEMNIIVDRIKMFMKMYFIKVEINHHHLRDK